MTRIKVVRDHEEVSFDVLEFELDLEGHLKVNIKFLNKLKPLFDLRFENFTFRYVVISVVKITSSHLEVKLVIVTEYAVEDCIEKNISNKNYRGHERLFGDLDFEFDLEIDLNTDLARHDRQQTRPAKARSVAESIS